MKNEFSTQWAQCYHILRSNTLIISSLDFILKNAFKWKSHYLNENKVIFWNPLTGVGMLLKFEKHWFSMTSVLDFSNIP